MTLRDSLVQAVEFWRRPGTLEMKRAFLERNANVIPSAEEEALLSLLGAFIPSHEWGAICVLAESYRRDHADDTLAGGAAEQVAGAMDFLEYTPKDFLRWPWKALDELVGGMAPGTVHYIVCPSKGGKTTLCRSASRHWIKAGVKVLYGGFEMKAETLRTMYAADDCGLDPGDVLSGKWLGFAHYHELRARMADAYREQEREGSPYQNLRFTSFEHVGRDQVEEMMQTAASWGAGVVIVDHIDHVDGGDARSRGMYETSVKTANLFLTLTKKYRLKTIITSQVNNSGLGQDRFRNHRPVQIQAVKFGAHKLETATTMLGMYRPLVPSFGKEDRQRVEFGQAVVEEYLWTNVNAFNVMAHRNYGGHIGRRAHLGWERGQIVDPPPSVQAELEAAKHGIKTARD